MKTNTHKKKKKLLPHSPLPHYLLTIWRNFAPQRKTKKQKRNIILQPKSVDNEKVEKVGKGFLEKIDHRPTALS